VCLLAAGALPAALRSADTPPATSAAAPATIDETRLALSKWIETQQIISKERKEWQQGKEILAGRVELVEKEIAGIEEKIKQSETVVAESKKKRDDLQRENDLLKAVGAQLTEAVTGMEGEVRRLAKALPTPLIEKLQPLYKRIPEDPTKTRVSIAERYQNVLGILNEVNKANNEVNVSYEVHEIAGGKPSEVKAIYLGLGQAYYVSATGEAGISHPTLEGWPWEPAKAIAGDVLKTLEIIQGKQTAAFVPLPVKIQ